MNTTGADGQYDRATPTPLLLVIHPPYKEILLLHSLGINNTRVAESCGCARNTVISTVQRAQEKDIVWEDFVLWANRK